MRHVFVETNWVVEAFRPFPEPNATALIDRAAAGEIALHVPAVSVREAEPVIKYKFTGRVPPELRAFRRLVAVDVPDEAAAVTRFFDRFLAATRKSVASLPARLDALSGLPGVDVFPLSDAALSRVLRLREVQDLKPFDEAILAAVLCRALELPRGAIFCELDADLQPIGKPALAALYDAAGISVRNDFRIPPGA